MFAFIHLPSVLYPFQVGGVSGAYSRKIRHEVGIHTGMGCQSITETCAAQIQKTLHVFTLTLYRIKREVSAHTHCHHIWQQLFSGKKNEVEFNKRHFINGPSGQQKQMENRMRACLASLSLIRKKRKRHLGTTLI